MGNVYKGNMKKGFKHIICSVDQAGSERTEAGESALPAEESPQPGRAKRKL